jgi:hypothetical protein
LVVNGTLTSEKAGEAQDISLNWSKDFVASKNGRFHSRESKVEVRRTRHGRLVGADKLKQQHEGPTSVTVAKGWKRFNWLSQS